MNLAVKLYRDVNVAEKPAGIPDAWPAEIKELGDGRELPGPEWLLMTTEEIAIYRDQHKADFANWYGQNKPPVPRAYTPGMPYADHWHGTTQYLNTQLRRWSNTAQTDSNGRVVFHLTEDARLNGPALFSSILEINFSGLDASGVAIQGPHFVIESVTATQLVLRGIQGTSVGVLIGGTILSAQFVRAGYTVYASITGVKAT